MRTMCADLLRGHRWASYVDLLHANSPWPVSSRVDDADVAVAVWALTGHMNPAVSLALMLNGRITIFRALCYWGEWSW